MQKITHSICFEDKICVLPNILYCRYELITCFNLNKLNKYRVTENNYAAKCIKLKTVIVIGLGA